MVTKAELQEKLAAVTAERDKLRDSNRSDKSDRKIAAMAAEIARLNVEVSALRSTKAPRERPVRQRHELEGKVQSALRERDAMRSKRRETIAARLRADLETARAVPPVAPVVEYVDSPALVAEIKRLRALLRAK